jgi:large subunit ribosomal protein L9
MVFPVLVCKGTGAVARCLSEFTPTRLRLAHSVRVILTQDIGGGEGKYKGDVVLVRAGFARNHLIPKKMALYATGDNFKRLGMSDPDSETVEERRERLERERRLAEQGGEELKAADVLRHYLRNKELKIWRRVDPSTNAVHPGMVDHKAVRSKLSKQLKIDLDEHETVHLRPTPVDDLKSEDIDTALEQIETEEECAVQIRQLGDFIAKISLAGGHLVPLKVRILKR